MSNDLRTRGFHHVTMVSTDAPRTLAFYGDLLGLGLRLERGEQRLPILHEKGHPLRVLALLLRSLRKFWDFLKSRTF